MTGEIRTENSYLPDTPEAARLRFLALHLTDLQSISVVPMLAPILLLQPLLDRFPPPLDGPYVHLPMAVVACWEVIGLAWFFVSRRLLARRYGKIELSPEQRWQTQRAMLPFMPVFLAVLLMELFFLRSRGAIDVGIAASSFLLVRVLDGTNVPIRRWAYGAGFAVCLGFYVRACLLWSSSGFNRTAASTAQSHIFLFVIIALSLFDYWLLRSVAAPREAA